MPSPWSKSRTRTASPRRPFLDRRVAPGLQARRPPSVRRTPIRFTFKLGSNVAVVSASAPKGQDKPKALRGTTELGRQLLFTELERTDLKELDVARTPGSRPRPGEAFVKVMRGRPLRAGSGPQGSDREAR